MFILAGLALPAVQAWVARSFSVPSDRVSAAVDVGLVRLGLAAVSLLIVHGYLILAHTR